MKTNPILRVSKPGGLDTAWASAPGTAIEAKELRFDQRGGWLSVGGFAEMKSGESWSSFAEVWSIAWFSRHNGAQRFLVYEYESVWSPGTLTMVYHQMQSGVSFTIKTSRTLVRGPWQRTQYLANAGWLYAINGHDVPMRWNGDFITRIGFDAPAPTPTLATGTTTHTNLEGFYDLAARNPIGVWKSKNVQRGVGLYPDVQDEHFVYGYRVAYVNDLGMESELSDFVFVSGDNRTATYGKKSVYVSLDEAPAHVMAIRIYRTKNVAEALNGENYFTTYFHSEWKAGVAVQFLDQKDDAELGPAVDEDLLGAFPAGAKYMALFKGTMFVCGMADAPDRLRYSAPLKVEQFPTSNYFSVGDIDAGEFRGMRATKNALVVFKERGIYLVRGDPASGFTMDTLTEDTGCSAPGSVVEVPGLGLLFAGADGVHVLLGALENTGTPTKVVDLSKDIRGLWDERVSSQHLLGAVATVYHRERCVWLQVPADGDWRPSLGLVYHYDIGQWSTREGWPINCLTESRDEYGWLWFGSWDTTRRGVHVYSPGFADKGGAAISSTYRSGWIDFGSTWDRADILHVQPYGIDYGGTRKLTMTAYRDRRVVAASTSTRDLTDHEQDKTVWGTAVWGTSVWDDYTLAPVRFDVTDERGSLGVNCREFSFEVTGGRFGLMGYDLEVAPRGGATDIKQLSNAIAPEK